MKIALATVGATGDIRPFAILASALVDRGHAVTVVTWPVHRSAMARPGVRVELAGPHADPERIEAAAADAAALGPMGQVAALRDFHLADGAAHYRRLRELLPGHDLVLLHGIHALAHAAVLDDGLPWASAAFDPVLLPTATAPPPGMPSLGPLNRAAWWMLGRALARAGRPLDQLLAQAGSAQRGLPLFRARSAELHIVAASPSIIVVPPDLPPGTAVTGAWTERSAPRPLAADLESFLAAGQPPVVITFGSMRGFPPAELRTAVDLLLAAGRRVVVQGPLDVGLSSPNLTVAEVVDHRALFPRSALVVHHGGAGTTHAVAVAGVPSVVVPHVGDQRYWAERLHRLGVAPDPLPLARISGERLAAVALSTAADREAGAASRVLAEAVNADDGLATSIGLLERGQP